MKTDRKLLTCNRCGHQWLSRLIPQQCAKCRSKYWNRERVRPVKTDK